MSAPRERLQGVCLVTRRLTEGGMPEVELVRGDGYHYFIFDSAKSHHAFGESYHTYSVMIPRFRSWSVDRWEQEGREFGKACREGKFDDANGRIAA